MLPNNFFPYLKHPHLTNAPHFVSKYTKCRRSSPEPYMPLFTEVRGRGILGSPQNVYPGGIEYPEGALMDDETMQLLKVLREQLGESSPSRSVDALAAANSLGLERDSLEFHRRLHDLIQAKYVEEPANPALRAQ